MAQKWNLQDIVPPARVRRADSKTRVAGSESVSDEAPRPRTRRAVRAPLSESSSRSAEGLSDSKDERRARSEPEGGQEPRSNERGSEAISTRKQLMVGILILLLLALGFVTTVLMGGATVTVTPKIHDATVQGTFKASQKPATSELGYELLTLEEVGERQVGATGEEKTEERAKGSITIFNAYSTTPQRLIKNTRFQSTAGNIYHIVDSVVVPGYTKDAGGKVVPGSLKVEVYAAGTGEKYNVATARFKAPGLSGEQHELIYAETSAPGISGGFIGTRFIIDDAELATVRQSLQKDLRDKLLARTEKERPNGFVLYDSAITFSFESLPAEKAGEKTALIKERARLLVPLFNESSLASFVARSTVPGYAGESLRLSDPSQLVFAYAGTEAQNLASKESFDFSLSGAIRLIANFDREALKSVLAGADEEALPGLLAKYPAIDKAHAVIRPVWKSSFPEDVEDIKVTETVPN